MKQILQRLKDGKIRVLDVASPVLGEGMVLVRNYYSLVSPGTEGSTVRVAKKSLIGKAIDRPQQAKQVIELFKQQGPIQTYRTVRKKLDSYSTLGYSSAGKVIDVAANIKEFSVGEFVACGGGGYANHAEIIAVPQNLCVRISNDADLKKAAYNTLGAISLQGIRQADLKIGETCAIIGLGLIGQLTSLILRASGIKVLGIDIDPSIIEIAGQHCVDLAFRRDELSLEEKIYDFTDGTGPDAVIIAAATKSLDPINFAGKISRKKGRVVVVGDVPTGFDRDPYYKKELEVRMSCSYGPGRYDMNYEEKGIDYPIGYIRWTEKRNMKAFQELIASNKIDLDYLTTHIFSLEEAQKAYELILRREELFLGILIKYNIIQDEPERKVIISKISPPGKVNIGFIGTGNYAMNYLLPNIPKDKDIVLKGVMDLSGANSRMVAEKYGFEFCASDENSLFSDKDINTILIATRHNSHASFVIKSLEAGKNTYVEKPLCLRESELDKIKEIYITSIQSGHAPVLMLGFNRRFSPITEILRQHIDAGSMGMIYRINAGNIPADSWIQDQDIGGGRIIGEVCHFVDFLSYINGSLPEYVYASAIIGPPNNEDTVNISLKFKNGSIGIISYFANGSRALFKEYIEVYKSGVIGVIKDFKEIRIYRTRRLLKKKLFIQDKGQRRMLKIFFDTIKNGNYSPIRFEEIYFVTKATFKIIESIRKNMPIQVI